MVALTIAQKESLSAIIGSFLPSIPVASNEDYDIQHTGLSSDETSRYWAEKRYWEYPLSTDPIFVGIVEDIICGTALKVDDRRALHVVLTLLSSRVGTSFLFGIPTLVVPFSRLPHQKTKEDYLLSLLQSPFLWKQSLFISLKKLICGCAYSYVVVVNDRTGNKQCYNPFWESIGYPGPNVPPPQQLNNNNNNDNNTLLLRDNNNDDSKNDNRVDVTTSTRQAQSIIEDEQRKRKETTTKGDPLQEAIINDRIHHYYNNNTIHTTQKKQQGNTHQDTVPIIDKFDIVIVGSGAGGSVAAATLSKAGYTVLVVEKSSYRAADKLSNLEMDSFQNMYESSGLLTTTDGSISILAGSTLGGGPAINWSCCLTLPDYVRNEWSGSSSSSAEYNLTDFRIPNHDDDTEDGKRRTTTDYERALQTITQNIIVSSDQDDSKPNIHHNKMNQKLKQGCDALNYKYESTEQNLTNTASVSNGYVCFGDKYGNKKSSLSVFLEDAIATGKTKILTSTNVDRILFNDDSEEEDNNNSVVDGNNHPQKRKRKKATGIMCTITNNNNKGRPQQRRVQINAKRAVIVAAGSLHTPCLLQQSGLKNKHIGKNLRLHPVTGILAMAKNNHKHNNNNNNNNNNKNNNNNNNNNSSSSSSSYIDSYLGSPLTIACNEFEYDNQQAHNHNNNDDNAASRNKNHNRNEKEEEKCYGRYYGCKIECPSVHPGLMATILNWSAAQTFKQKMQNLRLGIPLIVIQRDSPTSSGSVCYNRHKELTISYNMNEADKKSLMVGCIGAIRILFATNTHTNTKTTSDDDNNHHKIKEIGSFFYRDYNGLQLEHENESDTMNDDSMHDHGEEKKEETTAATTTSLASLSLRKRNQQKCDDYISYIQQHYKMEKHKVSFSSAHQMGSCRLSVSPTRGAIDANGETWEADDLYVMDASTFPTASGVNPMITVFTISQMLSSRLVHKLNYVDHATTTTTTTTTTLSEDDIARVQQRIRIREQNNENPQGSEDENDLVSLLLGMPLLLPRSILSTCRSYRSLTTKKKSVVTLFLFSIIGGCYYLLVTDNQNQHNNEKTTTLRQQCKSMMRSARSLIF